MYRCVALFAGLSLSVAAAEEPKLPPPNATKSVVRHPKVLGWPAGKTPAAPAGFAVTLFAEGFDSPRWLHVLPNGDILVAEARTMPKPDAKPEMKEGLKKSKTVTGTSANCITLLRDADRDGKPELREAFLTGLNQPLGMSLVGNSFFVANTDCVVRFDYKDGNAKLTGPGRQILHLPIGGYNNHWTRNLIASEDGRKLYISVGSASDVAENGMKEDVLRANILEANLDGTELRVFGAGLRNPEGMAWEPATKALWTAVNERDELGDELVPDYITSVKPGAFYG